MHVCYFIYVNVWLDPEGMKHMMDYVSMQCGYTFTPHYCRTQMMIDIVELTEKII